MVKEIGIDAGGSLIKIAYQEKGHLHTKTYDTKEMDTLIKWLKFIAPDATLYLTGGKSGYLKNIVAHPSHQADEFQAMAEGTRYLLELEKIRFEDGFILVSVGTGTSIYYVTSDSHKRLLGSGIGGGTLMGLGSIISGKKEFAELTELAEKGNHEDSDLLVRDIYAPNEPPIHGHLTAANFGKTPIHNQTSASDHMAALMQLIGESLILLAGQASRERGVQKIVFTGSTLNGNTTLKNVLQSFQEMIAYEAVFLEKGAYAGAIGAML